MAQAVAAQASGTVVLRWFHTSTAVSIATCSAAPIDAPSEIAWVTPVVERAVEVVGEGAVVGASPIAAVHPTSNRARSRTSETLNARRTMSPPRVLGIGHWCPATIFIVTDADEAPPRPASLVAINLGGCTRRAHLIDLDRT